MEKIEKTEQQWRAELTPDQYRILREKATEPAFTGEYDHVFEPGTYRCAGCGTELFSSDAKYDSGCGWPAFSAPASEDVIEEERDVSLGMVRTEVLVRSVRRPPRPRVPGRTAADGSAVLHQLGRARARGELAKPRRSRTSG